LDAYQKRLALEKSKERPVEEAEPEKEEISSEVVNFIKTTNKLYKRPKLESKETVESEPVSITGDFVPITFDAPTGSSVVEDTPKVCNNKIDIKVEVQKDKSVH